MSVPPRRSGRASPERRRLVAGGSGLAVAVVLAVVGLGLLAPSAAEGLPAASEATVAAADALLLRSGPPGTVHLLSPGRPALWDVGVTVRRTPVSTLEGVVTAHGGITSTGTTVPVDIELLGCPTPWSGPRCGGGARIILPPSAADALPTTPAALTGPARAVPANVWVQVRATMAADAPPTSTGTMTVRLTVEASGAGGRPGAGTPASALAGTGSSPLGAALLATAAVGGGIAVVSLARARRRDG